jgi:hypothetical protein
MTDKEVLQKAIEMAIENGYDKELKFVADFKENNPFVIVFRLDRETDPTDLNTVIFSHDFAKAFWGEGFDPEITEYVEYPNGAVEQEGVISWVYHLQQMVLEENPIDYLRKFVSNGENSNLSLTDIIELPRVVVLEDQEFIYDGVVYQFRKSQDGTNVLGMVAVSQQVSSVTINQTPPPRVDLNQSEDED